MTRQDNRTVLDDVVELVANHGTEAMAAAFTTLLDVAMKIERDRVLGAGATAAAGRRV